MKKNKLAKSQPSSHPSSIIRTLKDLLKAEPCKLRQPFTAIEISKSITSLKNNKSGIDNLKAEHLKHCPHVLSEKIANILNNSAETGQYQPKSSANNIIISITKNSSSHSR